MTYGEFKKAASEFGTVASNTLAWATSGAVLSGVLGPIITAGVMTAGRGGGDSGSEAVILLLPAFAALGAIVSAPRGAIIGLAAVRGRRALAVQQQSAASAPAPAA